MSGNRHQTLGVRGNFTCIALFFALLQGCLTSGLTSDQRFDVTNSLTNNGICATHLSEARGTFHASNLFGLLFRHRQRTLWLSVAQSVPF